MGLTMTHIEQRISIYDEKKSEELYFDVDLLVLVKNKLLVQCGTGWEMQFECLSVFSPVLPCKVHLYYFFESSDLERSKVQQDIQIGQFYKVCGTTTFENTQDFILLYAPAYEAVRHETLPRKFVTVLANGLTGEDLCFEYEAHGEYMKEQYEKKILFPGLEKDLPEPEPKIIRKNQKQTLLT